MVGDIITFHAGDRIPADCLLLESIDLEVDEAYHHDDAKTLVKKNVSNLDNLHENNDSFLLAESLVTSGSGKAIVLVVSSDYCTRNRRVISQNDDDAEVSPLQQRLGNIGSQIGKLGIYASGVLLLILAVRTAINFMASDKLDLINDGLESLVEIFVTCITLIMVAVPEGLPLSVSISVAYSLQTMKEKKLLIKNADSQELMGGVEYIITGKTGTLTKGEMEVKNFYLQGKTHVNKDLDYFSKAEDIDD